MSVDWVSGTGNEAYEVHGSPIESTSRDSFTQTVTLRVPWNKRYAVRDELLFGPTGVEGPKLYPYHSNPTTIATSIGITPDNAKSNNDGGDGLEYIDALLTVGFELAEAKETEPGSGLYDFISEEFTPTAEFLTIDHNGFLWGSATEGVGVPLEAAEAPGKLIIGADYTQTRYNLSSIHSDYLSLIGHTNNAAHTAQLLGVTFAIDTLLFNPPSTNRTIKSNGTGLWTLSSTFTYKPTEWNKFWRAKEQQFEEMYILGDSRYFNYPQGSFANILV